MMIKGPGKVELNRTLYWFSFLQGDARAGGVFQALGG
jgi:hypothetical protein